MKTINVVGYKTQNSKEENYFVYQETPDKLSPYNWVGAFINKEGELLSIVNPYKAKFYALTWAQNAETREFLLKENFFEDLWQKIFVGQYNEKIKRREGDDYYEYFQKFTIQQPDWLEEFTYHIGVSWPNEGYHPQEPFLLKHIKNDERVVRKGRRSK